MPAEIPIPETVPQVAQAGEGALPADAAEIAVAEGQDEIANAMARQHAGADNQAAWFAAPHLVQHLHTAAGLHLEEETILCLLLLLAHSLFEKHRN
jgi:hypothetical protein